MNSKPSTTAALIVVCVVFCVTLSAVLIAFLFAPEGSNADAIVGPLLGTLAPTIAAVALLVQVKDVKDAQAVTAAKVDQVATDTYRLTNGLLDAKVRAGVADVIRPEHIDPAAENQLVNDRRVRDEVHYPGPSDRPASPWRDVPDDRDPHRP